MKKLIQIAKDASIKVSSKVEEYLSPNEVYLQIDSSAKILFKKKKVTKGQALFKLNDETIYSPISGEIEKVIERTNFLNEKVNYLMIKNDFEENDSYTGIDSTTIIISTNLKKRILDYQDWSKFQNKKTLILNGIEDEPYLANKTFMHKNHADELLIMLDSLAQTFDIPNIKIYLKETDRESIEAFNQILNTYPNIALEILPDYYPLGHPLIFSKFLKLTDNDIVVHTETLLDYYYEIFKTRKKDFIYVTLTGDAITYPKVYKVKIGTSLEELLDSISLSDNYVLMINGLMKGINSTKEKVILDKNIRAVYFMKEKNVNPEKCQKCGKCIEVCPLKCNPYKSYKTNGSYKNKDCIHCGLCTFICKSNIELEKYLKEEICSKHI